MKKIASLFFLSFLLVGSSCSFLTPRESDSSTSSSTFTGDRGYLKIKPEWRDYYTTEYVFIGEEGHQFYAEGKNEEGKDASYTFVAKWESSDETILHIDSKGIAKGMSNGIVTVKATYKQYSDEILGIKTIIEISKVGSSVGTELLMKLLMAGKTMTVSDLETKINNLYSSLS